MRNKLLAVLLLLSNIAVAQDVIINKDGTHYAKKWEKAVFVSVLVPKEMQCITTIKYESPKSENDKNSEDCDGLVVSPGPSNCKPGK